MNPGGDQALGPLAMMNSWWACHFLRWWVRSRSDVQAVVTQKQLHLDQLWRIVIRSVRLDTVTA